MKEKFIPKPFVRNPLFQTIYGSLRFRSKGSNPMLDNAREAILDGGRGVRLQGFYSAQKRYKVRGMVLLIHGWEGSSNSSYIVSTGKFLYNRGFDVFRLNLRDHGESHHLNKGIFKSTLIEETFNAVKNAALMNKKLPFYIAGFSLGGNFALRIALRNNKTKIPNLKHVAAISPVLDPEKSMAAADKVTVIRKYFLKKWRKSLIIKKSLFPDVYDFDGINEFKYVSAMTDAFVPVYTEFASSKEYYSKYTLLDDALIGLKIPVTIITSEDDPVIPVEDFRSLKTNSKTEIIIHRYGGHNGFFDLFPYQVWYEEKLCDIFRMYYN